MRRILLVRFGEVFLKGQNRPFFMKKLMDHIKLAVRVVVPNKPDFMRAFCKKPDAPEKGPEGAPRRWVLVGERAQLALPAPVRRTLEELEAGLFKRV